MNTKGRCGARKPSCVVVVATIRALKMHGGAFQAIPGRALPADVVAAENMEALGEGCENLAKQIENVTLPGIPAVLALNRFTTDRDSEIDLVMRKAKEAGAFGGALSGVWARGGAGGGELAKGVISARER